MPYLGTTVYPQCPLCQRRHSPQPRGAIAHAHRVRAWNAPLEHVHLWTQRVAAWRRNQETAK